MAHWPPSVRACLSGVAVAISVPNTTYFYSHSHRMFECNSRSLSQKFPHFVIRTIGGLYMTRTNCSLLSINFKHTV